MEKSSFELRWSIIYRKRETERERYIYMRLLPFLFYLNINFLCFLSLIKLGIGRCRANKLSAISFLTFVTSYYFWHSLDRKYWRYITAIKWSIRKENFVLLTYIRLYSYLNEIIRKICRLICSSFNRLLLNYFLHIYNWTR